MKFQAIPGSIATGADPKEASRILERLAPLVRFEGDPFQAIATPLPLADPVTNELRISPTRHLVAWIHPNRAQSEMHIRKIPIGSIVRFCDDHLPAEAVSAIRAVLVTHRGGVKGR